MGSTGYPPEPFVAVILILRAVDAALGFLGSVIVKTPLEKSALILLSFTYSGILKDRRNEP